MEKAEKNTRAGLLEFCDGSIEEAKDKTTHFLQEFNDFSKAILVCFSRQFEKLTVLVKIGWFL